MKKVVLSALAATIVTSAVYAETMTLFTDPKTGQVFTTAGEGRVEMGDFIDAKSVDMQMRDTESKFSEYQDKQSKYVNVKSKSKTLEFSGVHYFGFTSARPDNETSTKANSSGFEMRRNYVQVKGYFNDKDYFRVTMDATKELNVPTNNLQSTAAERDSSPQINGMSAVFIKYAYIWLDNVLPYTGVEVGMIHRPWIDYEEHNSWYYRSWSKVALENRTGTAANSLSEHGPDLVNSADLGVNFKTKTDYFASEIAIMNGEGYHADKAAGNQSNSQDLSLEWRLTADLLGQGKKQGKYDVLKDTYAHISTYGLMSRNHKDNNLTTNDNAEYDRRIYGLHAVYNQPEFLIAGQIYMAKDVAQSRLSLGNTLTTNTNVDTEYTGFSINGEYRPIQDWTVIGRYDAFRKDSKNTTTGVTTPKNNGTTWMYGLAYKYNKNVTFIGSGKVIDDNAKQASGVDVTDAKAVDKSVYMMTTSVNW